MIALVVGNAIEISTIYFWWDRTVVLGMPLAWCRSTLRRATPFLSGGATAGVLGNAIVPTALLVCGCGWRFWTKAVYLSLVLPLAF